MTDKELLDLAARAAGINGIHCFGVPPYMGMRLAGGAIWNPLTNDGDALRLAVQLKLSHLWQHDWLMVYRGDSSVRERDLIDPYAATRALRGTSL